jgi:PIN like domain
MLRAAGLRVVTLAEHYGIPEDESVADIDWLRLVGERKWIAFMKDDRIRYVPAEKAAFVAFEVRAFVITNASLSAQVMANRIVSAMPKIHEICQSRSGPRTPRGELPTPHRSRLRSRCRRPNVVSSR